MVHVSNFWGVSGSEDRGGDDNSIQIINIGRVGDKSFIEFLKNGGGGGEWQQCFDFFLYYWLDEKCLFKKLHFGLFFLFVCLKFRNSWTSLLVLKALSSGQKQNLFHSF